MAEKVDVAIKSVSADNPLATRPAAPDDSYTQQVNEAVTAMEKKLPPYVINCFLAAGFDTLTAIATIDTSKSPGNTLNEIQDYCNSEYPGDDQFLPTKKSKSCKFLLGHRRLIEKFVKDLQAGATMISTVKDERKVRKQHKSVRSVPKATTEENGYEITLDRKLGDIRRQIAKWQRKEKTDEKLKCLRERNDYDIKVKPNGASIFCNFCKENKTLGMKDGKALISNWTRHVTTCIVKSKSRQKTTLQSYLKFDTPTGAATCSASAETSASGFELAINTIETDSDHSFHLSPPLAREGDLP